MLNNFGAPNELPNQNSCNLPNNPLKSNSNNEQNDNNNDQKTNTIEIIDTPIVIQNSNIKSSTIDSSQNKTNSNNNNNNDNNNINNLDEIKHILNINNNNYELISNNDFIGKGGYGMVYKYKMNNEKLVAVKIINKKK